MTVVPAPAAQPNKRVQPTLTAAPKIRQMYWCDYWQDWRVPEIGKKRPVIVVSFKNKLHTPCTVVPVSSADQEGLSTQWAHKLSIKLDGTTQSWVACNHIHTICPSRLTMAGHPPPVVPQDEFDQILSIIYKWLPAIGGQTGNQNA